MNTKVIGMMDLKGRHESACRVYDTDYISPCITTMGGGGQCLKLQRKQLQLL